MPPWRISRGLTLLTCLTLTLTPATPGLATPESPAITRPGNETDGPATSREAPAMTLGGVMTPAKAATPAKSVTLAEIGPATSGGDATPAKAATPAVAVPLTPPRRALLSSEGGGGAEGTGLEVKYPLDTTLTPVVLLLVLLTLAIALIGACWRLQEFGGKAAYYPYLMERGLGGGAGGTPGWARSLLALLPGRRPPQGGSWDQEVGLTEEDRGAEEEEEEEEGAGGEEEDQEEEEEEDEAGEANSLSDYSSMGGIDLRGRAGLGEGEDEDSFPSPPPTESPRGSLALGDLHSFSGTAQWTDVGQDVTAL